MRGGARGGGSRQAVVERVRPVAEREREDGRVLGGGSGVGVGEVGRARGEGQRGRRITLEVARGDDDDSAMYTRDAVEVMSTRFLLQHPPRVPPKPSPTKRQTPNAKYQIPNFRSLAP
jgi:hypothetical protein